MPGCGWAKVSEVSMRGSGLVRLAAFREPLTCEASPAIGFDAAFVRQNRERRVQPAYLPGKPAEAGLTAEARLALETSCLLLSELF